MCARAVLKNNTCINLIFLSSLNLTVQSFYIPFL